MKNTKTKIILSAIIFLLVAGFTGIVFAASPSLYVSPASLTKTVGNTFGVSIGVNASGSKVCAVEGTIVFNNLSCQSITVASDATPQSSPTCSSPHFLIGVPGCTTAGKVLFTVSVKAGSTGAASISFTGVDIIGEGVSLGSTSVSGNYTINAVPKPTPTPISTPTSTPASTPTPTPTPTPIPENITPQQEETTPTPPIIAAASAAEVVKTSLLASIANILSFGTGKTWISIITILIVSLVLISVVTYSVRKIRRNKI